MLDCGSPSHRQMVSLACLFEAAVPQGRPLRPVIDAGLAREDSMIDFAAARRMMVDGQVRTSDVTDLRLIAAMLELPRERFVPKRRAALAYLDMDVTVAEAAD